MNKYCPDAVDGRPLHAKREEKWEHQSLGTSIRAEHLSGFSIAISLLRSDQPPLQFGFFIISICISKLAMASSSSTAGCVSYQVFLNHRGPDVKKTFVSHLYRRLVSQGLKVFLDQEEMQRGEYLTSQIESAIRTAFVHAAVFSPGYADSVWCLNELLQMLESRGTIIPVFYGIKPSELRWTQSNHGKYAEALHSLANKTTYDDQTLQKKLRYNSSTIESWRKALDTVSHISGLELESCNGDEGELLDLVVEEVLKRVKKTPLHVAKYPTGLDEKVQHFENEFLLQQQGQSAKPPVLGIIGLGGLGKTTLAKELFNRKSSQYNRSCFLSDVRENAGKGTLISLQKKLLKSLTGSDPEIDCIDQGMEMLKQTLSSCHALIVVDDVDQVDQIDSLLPDQTVIPSDSLILITSRYKDILTSSGIENSSIYKLTPLNEQQSRELFCSHAFKQPYPLSQFESFVNKFLDACKGLPLSLKVFGALCGRKNESFWEDQLDKLQRILPTEIKQRLQISYEALDLEEREIFIDVACFFIGEKRDMAVKIWDGCKWKGFQNLEDRCLVEVDSKNVIHMHDHLRDLGRDIAKAPGLVRGIDKLDELLQPSSVISEVRGIRDVRHPNGVSDITLHRGILQLPYSGEGLVEHILTRVHLPDLIWLRWYNCPYSSLPSWVPVKNLRVLEVDGKQSTSLWEGEWQAPLQLRDLEIRGDLCNIPNSIGRLQYLERMTLDCYIHHTISRLPGEFCRLQSLKTLVLHSCVNIKSLPDSFGDLRNIQRIDLSFWSNLEKLPETFGNLIKLKYLDLSYCSKLTMSSETLGNISTFEHLNLQHCAKIEVLPFKVAHQRSLERLYLSGTNIKELPKAIGELSNLEILDVGSPLLDTLPPSLSDLRNLKTLCLNGCDELKCFPSSVGLLTQLTELSVWGCPISELSPSLGDLRSLKELHLGDCKELKCLPASVGLLIQLAQLTVRNCSISELPHSLGDLRNLKTLCLKDCKELKCFPASVGRLTQLTELTVWGCPISELPPSLGDLRNLKELELSDCKELKCLPASVGQLIQLAQLTVRNCPIRELPHSLRDLRNLKTLCLEGCKELKCFPASVGLLTQLTELTVRGCPISELPPSVGDLRNLKKLDLDDCKELKCLPAFVGQLTNLSIRVCPISELPPSLGGLRYLYLYNCTKLKCWPAFGLLAHLKVHQSCAISELPSFRDSRNLKVLWLCSEHKLEELPGFEHLRSLEELTLIRCVKLKKIRGLAQCTKLRSLWLGGCFELEDLEGVEHCTSLRSLYVSRCPKLQLGGGVMEQLQQRLKGGLSFVL